MKALAFLAISFVSAMGTAFEIEYKANSSLSSDVKFYLKKELISNCPELGERSFKITELRSQQIPTDSYLTARYRALFLVEDVGSDEAMAPFSMDVEYVQNDNTRPILSIATTNPFCNN